MHDNATPETEAEHLSDSIDSVHLSGKQILHAIWAPFYNKKIGLFLILLVGVLNLIGVVMPQTSLQVRADPQAWNSFLHSIQEIYGGWTNILGALGFFNIFSSWFYLLSMLLLCLSIIGCTVHRLPLLWKNAVHPHVKVRDSFYERARLKADFTTPATLAQVETALQAHTKHWFGRILPGPQTEQSRSYYIDRFRWAPFGTALSHAAFIIVIAGFLVSSFTGFRDDNFALTVGYEKEVGFNTGLVAKAASFKDSYYENGAPADYVTDLIIYKAGNEVARQEVRVNSPLTVDDVTFHQASFGVSVVVKITDKTGKTIYANGIPLTRGTQDGIYSFGSILLPEQNLDLYAVTTASGQRAKDIQPGQIRIELYAPEATTPTAQKVINQGEPTEIADLTITFEREAQYTGITVKNDPGTIVVWIGFALLTVGITVTMALRHQRIWVRVRQIDAENVEVHFATHDKTDVSYSHQFEKFTTQVKEKITA